jgi:hypothetical protein
MDYGVLIPAVAAGLVIICLILCSIRWLFRRQASLNEVKNDFRNATAIMIAPKKQKKKTIPSGTSASSKSQGGGTHRSSHRGSLAFMMKEMYGGTLAPTTPPIGPWPGPGTITPFMSRQITSAVDYHNMPLPGTPMSTFHNGYPHPQPPRVMPIPTVPQQSRRGPGVPIRIQGYRN